MQNIWIVSDTHFDHGRIIELCDRPFRDVNEMNNTLIENWNKVVKPNDMVYHLGDFSFSKEQRIESLVRQLNGKIILILGNHDKLSRNFYKNTFERVFDYYKLRCNNEKYILFHYPIYEWDGFFRGTIHLHGHVHGNSKNSNVQDIPGRQHAVDMSVDSRDWRPVNIDEIAGIVNQRAL